LLGLSRSSYYYEGRGESEENLRLMNLLDEQYTKTPFYGSPRMTAWLRREGYQVNVKRVRRLMKLMDIEAIRAKPNLSKASVEDRIYPYLLRGVRIERVNQVWSIDITYIRMQKGFLYLVAIIDWFSRMVLSWELSNSLESSFCISALARALEVGKPEIFNSDQGVQFRSQSFTSRLLREGIQISMDGRGRAFDNIFIERLWRSVKYEEVYIKGYSQVKDAVTGLGGYFEFYNQERLHQSLNYRTPKEVYFGEQK
jgi:putative transposase